MPATASAPVITDPTGGQKNFNILDIFKEFGYTPSQAEIDALSPSFSGSIDPLKIGTSAVAQYVNYKNQINEFEANDPLTGIQNRMNDLIAQNENSVKGLQIQLQDTLSAAPELFGSLTPDQINAYLAPMKTAYDTQLSTVQAVAASRGLGASSTEANALAQTDKQFKEDVLNTGLNIGLTSQQNKAKSIQDQINNLFGQTTTAMGLSAGAGSQKSAQDLSQSSLFASLPSFLNAQSAQQEQISAANKGGGFWDTFNKVTSGINTGINAFENLAMIPQQFQASPKSAAPGAPVAGPNPTSPDLSLFNTGASGYARYAQTGTMFE